MIFDLAIALMFQDQTNLRGAPTVSGLTVWVWDVDGNLSKLPTIGEGQTPNVYRIESAIDLRDGIPSDTGLIRDTFVGRAFGYLRIPASGKYQFRLSCDDGAQLFVGGKKLLDTETQQQFVDEIGVDLLRGDYEVEIPFYENSGNFYLKLEWRKPGDQGYSVIPSSALHSQAGQTFVTSPGTKRWFVATDPRRPGDGRPLDGIHPSIRLETIRPEGFTPAVGGMCFLPNGTLAVCTWDQIGAVHLVHGLNGPSNKVWVTTFAEGLGEPLGIATINGELWVTQKGEIVRLRDIDRDGNADAFDTMAGGWPASHNYHEFTFNLVHRNSKLYIATSVPLRGGWTYYNPGSTQAYPIPTVPGSVLEIDPKTGQWSVFASGLRTPNGMGIGVDGEIFVADNQGSWLPCSRINHVRKGGFYGHQGSPDGKRKNDPPALWLPHGEISNSPSEMVVIPDGMYKGQLLFGDVTYGGIQRASLEKVNGVYQGAVFRFTQGLEAGVNRLTWGPDGKLYVGGIGSNGNWNHKNHRYGLQRLAWNGKSTFEMHSIRATPNGFIVAFTQPVQLRSKDALQVFEVTSYRYELAELYGGPKVDVQREKIRRTEVSSDKKAVQIHLPMLKKGYVYHIRALDVMNSQDQQLWSTESWYTLNEIPKK